VEVGEGCSKIYSLFDMLAIQQSVLSVCLICLVEWKIALHFWFIKTTKSSLVLPKAQLISCISMLIVPLVFVFLFGEGFVHSGWLGKPSNS
jgi:hypothetical protein